MGNNTVAQSAIDRAQSIPLDEIDFSHPDLWRTDSHWRYFERLRREDRVHSRWARGTEYGFVLEFAHTHPSGVCLRELWWVRQERRVGTTNSIKSATISSNFWSDSSVPANNDANP